MFLPTRDASAIDLASNRGDAYKEPHYYDSGHAGPRREVKLCKINDHTFKAFDYHDPTTEPVVHYNKVIYRFMQDPPIG